MRSSIAVVIPTQGKRPTLSPLIDTVREVLVEPDFLLIALNNSSSDLDLSHAHTLKVPSGYSSSRNTAASRAIDLGATSIVFIDDDVVVRAADLERFLDYIRTMPNALVAFPVEKRLPPEAQALARHILQATSSEGQSPSVLPASFLHVPSAAFERLRFPESLDFTGAEDTLFTEACLQGGFSLIRLPWSGPHEFHDSTRTTPSELVARVMASKAAIELNKRCTAANWRSSYRLPGYPLLASAIGAARFAHPLAPYYLAAAVARVLALLHLVPVKEGGKWRAFRFMTFVRPAGTTTA